MTITSLHDYYTRHYKRKKILLLFPNSINDFYQNGNSTGKKFGEVRKKKNRDSYMKTKINNTLLAVLMLSKRSKQYL